MFFAICQSWCNLAELRMRPANEGRSRDSASTVVYSTGNLFRVFTNVVGFSHLYEIGQHADVDIGRICRKQSWAQRSACTWGATGLPLVPQTHERRDTGGLLHTGMNFRVALMITFSSKRCRRRQSVLGLPRAPLMWIFLPNVLQ